MRLGYNTNGFAFHRLEDAIAILADLGYQSVAITLDYQALNPFDANLAYQVERIRRILTDRRLSCVIETGARFLLDPWHKHQPTLLSPDPAARGRRRQFLQQAVKIASDLGSDVVSFWSGTPLSDEPHEVLLDRLTQECQSLADQAAEHGVRLAFEPEPGMFIDTMARYEALKQRVTSASFGLTIDVGHLHCLGETPISDHLRAWRHLLWNVHIEDMRRGVHDHLLFGEGEMDFPPILKTLREIGYAGGIHVELSRHAHDAVSTARRAFSFLQPML